MVDNCGVASLGLKSCRPLPPGDGCTDAGREKGRVMATAWCSFEDLSSHR